MLVPYFCSQEMQDNIDLKWYLLIYGIITLSLLASLFLKCSKEKDEAAVRYWLESVDPMSKRSAKSKRMNPEFENVI